METTLKLDSSSELLDSKLQIQVPGQIPVGTDRRFADCKIAGPDCRLQDCGSGLKIARMRGPDCRLGVQIEDCVSRLQIARFRVQT
jgi:hypothetical protein